LRHQHADYSVRFTKGSVSQNPRKESQKQPVLESFKPRRAKRNQSLKCALSLGQVACGIWHYVALTVAVGGSGNLYVDGSLTGYDIATSIDLHKQPHVSFQTSSRPDDEVYTITTVQPNVLDTCTRTNGLPPCTLANDLTVVGYPGYFRVGGGFYGFIDEVRVWNKALSPAEVDADKFTRQVFTGEGHSLNGGIRLKLLHPVLNGLLHSLYHSYTDKQLVKKAVRFDVNSLKWVQGRGGAIIGFGAPKSSLGSGKPILKFSPKFW
jgi:hypothetical protein